MPDLVNHQAKKTTKLLLIGDSGSGKTGALASLAAAGYNLRIIDLDNGADILANLLSDPSGRYGPEAISRVKYETITDRMKAKGDRLVPGKAEVWKKTIEMVSHWKTPTEDLGPIADWTENDILVVDSLSTLSNAAMNWILAINGRLGKKIEQSDWFQAQGLVEGFLQTIYDEGIRCNVIIIAHVKYIGGEDESTPLQGLPNTLGKALPPVVGRYFNSILLAKAVGKVRKIYTSPNGVVVAKNSNPGKVKESYELATGLAEYFRDVRGAGPQVGPSAPPSNQKESVQQQYNNPVKPSISS